MKKQTQHLFKFISLVLLIQLRSQISFAQRSSSDFILPCGPTSVGKLIPIIDNEIKLIASTKNNDSLNVYLIKDEFCKEGKAYSLIQFLKDNPLLKIEISAHSRRKTIGETKILAEKVKNYLVKHGIDATRLESVGKGSTELLISDASYMKASSNTEKLKIDDINYRIELKIIADQYKSWFGIADQKFYSGQILDPALGIQLKYKYDALFSKNEDLKKEEIIRMQIDTAYRVLNVISIFLQTHPEIVIEIGITSFKTGDKTKLEPQYRARIKELQNYLVSRGAQITQTIAKVYFKPISNFKPEEISITISKGN